MYVRCLSTKPEREMNDALDSVYCKWIVEWSKAKTCISNLRNTFEAQEIFARGGHCHRPSAHVRILCCTSLSFSEAHIQHDLYADIHCILCTCANVRFNSFFFFFILYCIVWVHKNQNYMFILIVLSCLIARLPQPNVPKTNWCIKRVALFEWAKMSQSKCFVVGFFFFILCVRIAMDCDG